MCNLCKVAYKEEKTPQVNVTAIAMCVNCSAAVMFQKRAPQPNPSPSSEPEQGPPSIGAASVNDVRAL